MEPTRITSSFRDPSGYVFSDGQAIKRAITPIYFKQYQMLSGSGFYEKLFDANLLIRHHEVSNAAERIVLEAEKIPFITYPYEWSFLQYKHAALLTLKIQKLCLENGFTLKDASAFNVTFYQGKPIFIDTLSFDLYNENEPWKAYKQFVMHFLGPLVLAHYFGLDFLKTLASDLDGIPLQKLSKLLPVKSWLSPTLFANIHLLAKYDGKYAAAEAKTKTKGLSKSAQLKLIESLYDYIKNLKSSENTEWDNYYNQINYNDASYLTKKEFTRNWFSEIKGKTLIDIGGNDGTFSREIIEAQQILVADIDPNAVEQNYKKAIRNKETNICALVADVLNPAASYGFGNEERFSFIDRVKAFNPSGCLALAVIHHITLSGNIPFELSARFFAKMAPELLIEFPTRNDSWVQFLLKSKRDFTDHFDFYNEDFFEKAYIEYFDIVKKQVIPGSERILYSLKLRK